MKTIEQRAIVKADTYYREDRELRNFHSFYDGYIQGAEEALRSQWRSIKDEMPKDGKKCVIMDKDGSVRAAVYNEENSHFGMDMGAYIYQIKTVRYWMPIPDYRGKEADNG